MAKINTTNYQPVTSWNGTQDLLIVEQPDGTKVATPEQVKQYVEAFMDDEPTEGSEEAVKSGGVFDAIEDSVSLKTATGNPITLTDAANANAEELLMAIEPIQSGSGDPSPTNVRPISGLTEGKVVACGKNKFNEDTLRMGDYNNTTSNVRYSQNVNDRIKCTAGTSYIISAQNPHITNGTLTVYVRVTDASNHILSDDITVDIHLLTTPLTVTANNNGYLTVIFGCTVGDDRSRPISLDDIKGADVMIRLATETDPTFESYTGTTATITFGQTVYGGTVNFKTGEVTVTHGMVDFGTVNWTKTGDSGITYFYTSLPSIPQTTNPQDICSNYVCVGTYAQLLRTNNSAFQNHNKAFMIRDDSLANVDAAAFKTAMSGVQLCYELATPTTLTLTPAELELLKGNNTITANGVEISIEYYPDNAIGALAGRVDDKADKEDVDAEIGDLSQTGLTGDSVAAQLAGLENIKVANVSATMSCITADAKAIGGYRSVSSTSKVLSTFAGYPTGKTVVAENLYAYGENAAILGVVHVINGVVYLNAAASGDYTVHGHVFYKD